MAVYLIKPDAACRWLKSYHATYLSARAGANLSVENDGLLRFGQEANKPYQCWEAFLDFDTSAVQGTVLEAKIAWFSGQSMSNLQTFTAQVRAHDYGGGAPTTDDWVPGANINDVSHPIFATQTGAIIKSCQEVTATPYQDCGFTTAEGGESLINVGGHTKFIVVIDNFVAGTQGYSSYYTESGAMNLATAGLEPVLILYTTASGPPVITTARSRWNNGASLTIYTPGGITPSTVMFAFKTGVGSSSDGRQSGENWAGVHYLYGGDSSVCNTGLDWKLAETKDVDLTELSYAFTAGTGSPSFGVMFGVLGLDLDESIIGAKSLAIDTVSDVTAQGSAIVTSAAQRALLMGVVSDDGAYAVSGYQVATDNPPSWQEGFDVGYSTTRELAHALGVKPLAGSTGTPQATLASAGMAIVSLVELTPKVFVEWSTASVSINAGASSTDDNDVLLTLAAAATLSGSPVTADKMRFSEDGEAWGDWENYATTKAWQLPAQSDEDPHTCTVYAQFRVTEDGTDYDSDAVSDSITLQIDWTESVRLNGGAPTTYGTTVDVTLAATSSAGAVTHHRLREDGGSWSAWRAYLTALTLELDGTGSHTVEAQFRDADDNVSPGCSASITVLEETEAAEIITTEPVQVVRAGILVYMGDQLIAELEAIGGDVQADSRRSVWRTATIDFAPTETLTFAEIYQLLATPGIEVTVRRGWRLASGDEVIISLGRFVVDEVTLEEADGGTAVSANLSDLATRIQRARFTEPYVIASGTALATALAELLVDRWADVLIGFDTSTVPNTIEAQVVLEAGDTSDPWSDAQNIAQAHGYVLYFDAAGVARLQVAPDPNSVTPTYFYYRDESAVVVGQTRVAPMERTYSGVVVTGEGSGLATPVRAEAWDEGPQSPTNVNGPFGYVPYFYSSPLITTTDQAKDVALAMLTSVTGRVEQLSWQQVPNPAVKPLDAVELEDAEGYYHTYLIDEVTIPLAPTEAMTAAARETRTDTLWVADDYLS